jgi:uncharacterized protein (TIGR02677 family)
MDVHATSPYQTFIHLGTSKVAYYRQVLRAFLRAKEQFEIALRPSEVLAWLPADSALPESEIPTVLEQLCEWRNLDASPDVAEVRTVEEFNRPRFLYHFTAAGEATENALSTFDQHVVQPGELQASALREILSTLEDLEHLLLSEALDVGKSTKAIRDLIERFQQLVSRAQSFMRSIQSSLVRPTSEVDLFLQHKEALLTYLEKFIGDLVLATYRVSCTLSRIEALGIDRALRGAAEAALADALNPDAQQREAVHEHWQLVWQGLRKWFLGQSGSTSQAEALRARALAAIPALLETVRRINDQRASRTDRHTDFITLARWFVAAPSEGDLHRLWRVAFGLSPARHFRVNDETFAAWESAELSSRTTWAEAPPFYITPRLRETGRAAPRGPVRAIVDRSSDLAKLAELTEAQEMRLLAARNSLATGRSRRLSELPTLGEAEIELLLDLLGQALGAEPDSDGIAEALSEDGTLFIRVAPPTPTSEEAIIVTDAGTLCGPDYAITISDAAVRYFSRTQSMKAR